LQTKEEYIDVPPHLPQQPGRRMQSLWQQSGQTLPYPRCLHGTGDMQLQIKVQDYTMFLLQEEYTVHCDVVRCCNPAGQ